MAVELKRHLHPSWPIAGQIRESLNTNSHSLTNFKCLVTFNRTLPGFCLQATWSLTSEEWKCLQGPDHLIQSIVATQNHCRYLVPAWCTVLYLEGDISSWLQWNSHYKFELLQNNLTVHPDRSQTGPCVSRSLQDMPGSHLNWRELPLIVSTDWAFMWSWPHSKNKREHGDVVVVLQYLLPCQHHRLLHGRYIFNIQQTM